MTDDRSANDVLMGSGIPSAKFDVMRVWVGGTIVTKPTTRQETEFGTGTPKTYPKSGDPIMGILVDVQTDQRTDAEDNGVRRMYIEGRNLKDATRDAVRASGADGLEIGGQLFLAWVAEGPPPFANANPPKLYEGKYYPPTTPVPTETGTSMPDPRQATHQNGQTTPGLVQSVPGMSDPRSAPNEFAPLPSAAPAPEFAQQQPQAAAPAPMGDPRAPSGVQPAPVAQNGVQAQNDSRGGPDPTAEAIAALRAAGLDPQTVFPGYRA